MSPDLLKILQFFLLALIWLFFLRVIRAVWVEVRPPKERWWKQRQDGVARPRGPYLRVLEPDGLRGQIYEIGEEMTVGRAAGCGVSIDGDAFVSNLHARVFLKNGKPWIEDLGSTNGTFVNSRRVAVPTPLKKGDLVKLGGAVLEVDR
ncbi:MAG: FHA domain-containing protein [Actinobacteria bacterium]|nr:FHA domain-containing protein [Actinomycetota bacterium]